MQKIVHKANTRGHANHGWLNSYHSFSFAGYHNPERVHFGLLRVLNDDTVAPGMGFGQHPHDNMEIVSIPLKGALQHKDTTGRDAIIQSGDVQIMSAGSGLMHSEFNHSKTEEVQFLQIWVFPKERNITPRYDQKTFTPEERKNKWQLVVSPDKNDSSIWINQDAFFSLSNLQAGIELDYSLKNKTNGVYIFLLEGSVEIASEKLSRRDAIGLWETGLVRIKSTADSQVLLMEIPMN